MPDTAYDLCERIAGALTAYACGDALGLPWENKPKASSVAEIEQLPAREGWPRGSTTDDTALTLLAARHLAERDGGCDARGFLADLASQEPAIRGLGPTTTAAIEQFRRGGTIAPSVDRATNGAAMRALPVGWVLPHAQADRRRQLAIEISRATHAAPAAVVAACVIATCASWALEGADPTLLLKVAADEAREAAQAVDTDARLAKMLTQVSEGTWTAPADGISLDPYETVTAVLSCVAQAPSLRDGPVNAVQLGGDTDTVAALVGGLLGCGLTAEQVRAEVNIQPSVAVLFPIALRDWPEAWVCSCGEGWHPGVPGEGAADGGDDVLAVLAGGVDVAADGVAVAGGGLGAEAAGDLLLGFRGAAGRARPGCSSAGSQCRVRNRSTSASRSLQAFQQQRPGFCFAVRAGDAADLRQPDADARAGTSARSAPVASSGTAARPCSRAAFAAWMRPRSASAAWPGQIAPG